MVGWGSLRLPSYSQLEQRDDTDSDRDPYTAREIDTDRRTHFYILLRACSHLRRVRKRCPHGLSLSEQRSIVAFLRLDTHLEHVELTSSLLFLFLFLFLVFILPSSPSHPTKNRFHPFSLFLLLPLFIILFLFLFLLPSFLNYTSSVSPPTSQRVRKATSSDLSSFSTPTSCKNIHTTTTLHLSRTNELFHTVRVYFLLHSLHS